MKTPLHLKLESHCRKMRKGEQHWFLKGSAPTTLWIPEITEVVTLRRVIYAAFVAMVPAEHEVVSTCGTRLCVRPEHMGIKWKLNSQAKALNLPEHLAAMTSPYRYQTPKASILPEGVTIKAILTVKYLADKNSLEKLRDATGLPLHEIMRIKGGVYDAAVKNVRGSTTEGRFRKEKRTSREPAHIPGDSLPISRREQEGPPVIVDSEEPGDAMWLELLKGG